ncbi:MAG: acetyl-CoA C-acyltransferase [Bacteroidota bacterium]
MQEVYICSAIRTPLGSFGGMFAKIKATDLGKYAIQGALEKSGVEAAHVEEVFMGNVCSANLGQAPARQAAIKAGISNTVPCTTINKVCSSGLKSVMLGAQTIMLGLNDLVVAGGMENMSDVPYYLPQNRWGSKYGDGKIIDGLAKDGLTDAYQPVAMGVFADSTAKEYNVSREAQDEYAIRSYQRAATATENKILAKEIVAVEVPQRKGDPIAITEDEEYKRVKFEKIPILRPAFTKDGTVTAANASTINDGAAAFVLASEAAIKKYGLTPIAKIVSFADAAHEPEWFTTAPTKAAKLAAARANTSLDKIDYFEVNEAFSVVPMVFGKLLEVSEDQMNIHGGAVSLGHPLGASGARILTTLCNVLDTKEAKMGMAAICNGGGGASALVVENLR